MPALWITASKRPSLLTSSASVLAPAMVERSPETTPREPAAAASASRLQPSFRPCNTTSWPWSTRSRAAMTPRPSDDPVMNTRATPRTSSYRADLWAYDPEWSPCADHQSPHQAAAWSMRFRQVEALMGENRLTGGGEGIRTFGPPLGASQCRHHPARLTAPACPCLPRR